MPQDPGIIEFGSLFIEHLLTPKLVLAKLKSSIPPITWIDEKVGLGDATLADVTGVARLRSIANPDKWANSQEIRFKSKITLSLSLTAKALSLSIPINAKVAFSLSIIFRAYHPLVLIADIPLLSRDDVLIFDSIEFPQPVLSGAIVGRIVNNVNDSIEKSASTRLIDLEQKLIEMASITTDPSTNQPADEYASDKIVMLTASDRPLYLELGPNQTIEGEIIAHPREVIDLKLYAARRNPPCALMDYTNLITLNLRESTWEQSLIANPVCNGHSFAPTFQSDTIRFSPHKAGSYRFRISSSGFYNNISLIKLIQSRALAEGPGSKDNKFIFSGYRQIGFDLLGQNLIQIGISNRVIKDKILEQFAILQKANKLVFSLDLPVLRLVNFLFLPKKVIVSDALISPIGTRCAHNVEVTALIQGVRQQTATSSERIFSIPIKLAMTILVAAINDPLAIQVELQDLDASQCLIDTSRLTAIDDLTRSTLEGLLSNKLIDSLVDFAIKSINSLLPLSLTTAAIDKVSSDIIKGTPPATGTPRKVFSQINLPAVTLSNNSTRLKSFYLSKGNRISVSVSFSQINYCSNGCLVVSICDKDHGVLEQDFVMQQRKGTIRIELVASYDGTHFLHLAAYDSGWSFPVKWEGFNTKVSIAKQ